MSIPLFKKAYERYWTVIEDESVVPLCSMYSYTENELSNRNMSHGFLWEMMRREFTRELINTLNSFAVQINSLNVWQQVINGYDETEQFYLKFEFTILPLYFCLHKPAEFRDRLIYCCTHLCHQATLFSLDDYPDRLVDEHRVKLGILMRFSKYWLTVDELVGAIKKISSDDYLLLTNNFRNKNQHRVPPALEYGHTGIVTRVQKDNGNVTYDFGFSDALTTEDMLPILFKQWQLMKEALDVYLTLIEEQNSIIYKVNDFTVHFGDGV
ncbi:hypothetical protein [Photobacterium leiognathi]|uniref:hypothetical protein n=1 Tax=Photobacterium leiognathi TaxID=553611 RepID=UPI002981F763|nr:hypothetical protein [Photobacterium leiognathi]